jgi:hypothetical protein
VFVKIVSLAGGQFDFHDHQIFATAILGREAQTNAPQSGYSLAMSSAVKNLPLPSQTSHIMILLLFEIFPINPGSPVRLHVQYRLQHLLTVLVKILLLLIIRMPPRNHFNSFHLSA